jgi:hypothetical protein
MARPAVAAAANSIPRRCTRTYGVHRGVPGTALCLRCPSGCTACSAQCRYRATPAAQRSGAPLQATRQAAGAPSAGSQSFNPPPREHADGATLRSLRSGGDSEGRRSGTPLGKQPSATSDQRQQTAVTASVSATATATATATANSIPPSSASALMLRGMGAWLQLCSPRTTLRAWHPLPSPSSGRGPRAWHRSHRPPLCAGLVPGIPSHRPSEAG